MARCSGLRLEEVGDQPTVEALGGIASTHAITDASGLSPERQARLLIDLARAHAQRRHIGEAVSAFLEAERLTPEQVQRHSFVRQVVHDSLNLAGRRATPDLLDLARRIGA